MKQVRQTMCREQIARGWGWRVDEMGEDEDGRKVGTSSCQINKFWGCKNSMVTRADSTVLYI